jgi:murein L,D-transpeptidase YcbB/YkuD
MKNQKKRLIVFATLIIVSVAGFNLTRMFQPGDADLRFVLNIPASRLDVFEQGVRTHSYAVSAGKREFATPAGKYNVREVIWNPWWHPPKSEWARNEKPYPPGANNPMGRIKINFADLYYIHGTPYEDDLGGAASHGCVRIGDADLIELARIIHKYRTPKVDEQLLSTLEQNRQMTRDFRVRPVPFDVVYRLVEVVDGKLLIHPDVYRTPGQDLRDEIMTTLKNSGVEVTEELEHRLEPLTKRRMVTRLSIGIDSLLAVTAAGD